MYSACLSDFALAALNKQGPRASAATVVNHALLVAALIERRGDGYVLQANDDSYMASIIAGGPKMGLWFAPDMRVSVCNLRYRDDFLAAASQGCPVAPQLVSFNFVYYNRSGSNCAVNKRVYTQSMSAFDDGIWHKALMATGASHAINIHATGEELPTDILAGGPLEVAQRGLSCAVTKKMDVLVRRDLVARPA